MSTCSSFEGFPMGSRLELERRLAELSAEIRAYPTPIARCDDQLWGLIQERSSVVEKLYAMKEMQTCSPTALWVNDGGSNAA